jgi:putative DNA-invertase from lambdoid prophage Rac
MVKNTNIDEGFWPGVKFMNVGLYARVSTYDQKTLSMQMQNMEKYAKSRSWNIILRIEDIVSGTSDRTKRNQIMNAARRQELDTVLVWKLDRWGRSVSDLFNTLNELSELSVGFVSITEALDLTTSVGKAMAGLLAVFANFERDMLSERIKAGIDHARKNGKPHGRPLTASKKIDEVKELFINGFSKSEIARKLNIGRTSVRRLLSKSIVSG